jgi:hypothetical protein
MNDHIIEEQALKVTFDEFSGGRGRGHGSFRGRGRGRGRNFDKSMVECYYYHKRGHFQYECPSKEKGENFVEAGEEILLMAYVENTKVNREELWYLDSGCSNHMCGKKECFLDLDASFR